MRTAVTRHGLLALALSSALATHAVPAAQTVGIFGPRKYVRTTGTRNVYTETVTVPAWIAAPFTLRVQNGEANGSSRVTSAWIELNGAQVASPSDFQQGVPSLDRVVSLTPRTTLKVTLASKPGSFLTIDLAGTSADHAPPTVSVDLPAPGATIDTARPRLVVAYADLVGTGERAASGIEVSTLKVTLDGVDRTALFARGAAQASADLPPSLALAEGAHTLRASIQDLAGNVGEGESAFSVDLTPTALAIAEPSPGAYLPASPAFRVTYADSFGLDLETLEIVLDGTARTGEFTRGAAEATATLALADGEHQITARIADRAGHTSTAQATFTIDSAPPVLSIAAPPDDSYHRGSPVTISGRAEDADPQLSVECAGLGAAVAATLQSGDFTCAVPLAESDNTVTVTARDRFREVGATRHLVLDTMAPQVAVTEPAEEAFTSAMTIEVAGSVADANPVTVRVDGAPAAVAGGEFRARGLPLGDEPTHVLLVEAEDAAHNTAETTVTVHVDRLAPALLITTPAPDAYLNGVSVEVTGTVADASPVSVDVNGEPAAVSAAGDGTATFRSELPLVDGRLVIRAVARDAAANTAAAEVAINVDTVAPVITLAEPADGLVTRASGVRFAGTIGDASPVRLTVEGAPVPLVDGAFAVEVPLPLEGPRTVLLAATDAAGNTGQLELPLVVDRTPPDLEILAPADGVAVAALPAVLQGLVRDANAATVSVDGAPAAVLDQAWQASVPALPEGPHRFTVEAVDAAGNAATRTRDVVVDLSPPILVVTAPQDGGLTREEATPVTGTVEDRTSVAVAVNGQPAVLTGSGPFAFTATLPLLEGDNSVTVVATDATGRSTTALARLTRDSTPPALDLLASEKISRGRPGHATASASDNLALAEVALSLNGVALGSFAAPPYDVALTVPTGATAGETLTLTAEARDTAGNVTRVSRPVRVVSDGVVIGQVLSDLTGLPLPGAAVRLSADEAEPVAVTTDERGRYSLPTGALAAVVTVERGGMTSVEREVPVASGVGSVPVDARLTPLASPVSVGPEGGSIESGPVRIEVPAGTVSASTAFILTPLSAQGLPGLLPLGWSPLAAFELRSDAASTAVPAAITGLGTSVVHLAVHRPALRAWIMVAPQLAPAAGRVEVSLPAPGAYALVAADAGEPPVAVPEAGEALGGVEVAAVPDSASLVGVVQPASIPPTGGTGRASLSVRSWTSLPSGTVLQAEVTESYNLASGETASEEKRLQDVVFFRAAAPADATLAAQLPITPARTFETTQLIEGRVRLDVLDGRESVRGQTGGSEPVSLAAGEARLSVPAHALGEDTAIALETFPLSSFLPSASWLVPLAELVVDLSGKTLGAATELSIAAPPASPDDTFLVARVERLDGVPALAVVAVAAIEGDRLVSRPHPRLPGITSGGRYVFYRAGAPIGFVAGVASSPAGPVKAVVRVDGVPFVALAGIDGRYVAAAPTGPSVAVTAVVLHTSLRAAVTAGVDAGQTTGLDLLLAGITTAANVSPSDGAVAVPKNTQVEITATAPLDPATVRPDNVRLVRTADQQPVAVRFVLTGSRRVLAVVPEAALAPATEYALQASGLADAFGGLVSVPAMRFTTKADVAPVYDTNALTFSFPDQDGLVHVNAPAGSLPPGTQVLVLDASNGNVLTATAANDGSVTSDLPASINDRLLVTITDPLGNITTFQRSQFVAPDGRTAIGPGGGIVKGDGGIEMRIPDGALGRGVILKIEPFGADRFPPEQKPNLPEAHFASGLTIRSEEEPTYKKEVKLAFPVPEGLPANPNDALFFVYRRLEGPEGRVGFQAIDYAKVEGDGENARVVTASYPFPGLTDSLGVWDLSGATHPTSATHYYLLWRMRELFPGGPTPGVVTGKVVQPVFGASGSTPQLQPVAGAIVSGVDDRGDPLYQAAGTDIVFAVSQADGRYTMWDPFFRGGTVSMTAKLNGVERRATAVEFFDDDVEAVRRLLGLYTHAAKVDFTFPAAAPPPPPSDLQIAVYRTAGGQREDINGMVVVGSPLAVVFKINGGGVVNTAGVQAGTDPVQTYAVGADPLGTPGQFLLNGTITPGEPASYTVSATGTLPFGGTVTQSVTFRVIAAGGGRDGVLPNEPPRVITSLTVPRDNSTGVPVSVLPQVSFTEPVRHVPGHVTLEDSAGAIIPIRLSAVARGGAIIPDLSDPEAAVTSVIVQPARGLKFGATYILRLSDAIIDFDTDASGNPAPKPLALFDSGFQTIDPGALGGSVETYGSPNIVVVDDKAFLVENRGGDGVLRVFDLSNPALPTLFPGGEAFVYGRPADIAGDGTTVAIVTNPSDLMTRPVRLYLFDVSNVGTAPSSSAPPPAPSWIGAVTLAASGSDGWGRRLMLHGSRLYALTFRKGLQVIDVAAAQQVFQPLTSPGHAAMVRDFNAPGGSFGEDSIVLTVPLEAPAGGRAARAFDLRIADYTINGSPSPVAVVVGEPGLGFAVVDTLSAAVLFQGALQSAAGRMDWAEAVEVATVGGRRIAVVAGTGTLSTPPGSPQTHLVAVVALDDLTQPQVLAFVPLTHGIGDVAVRDNVAVVSAGPETGSATLVDLTDPTQPQIAGTLSNVGSRMAFDRNGVLFSSDRSIFGGTTPLGGVRSTTFGPVPVIPQVDVIPAARDLSPPATAGPQPFITIQAGTLSLGIAPATYPVASASLQLYRGPVVGPPAPWGSPIPITLTNGQGSYVFPAGFQGDLGEVVTAILTVVSPSGATFQSHPRLVPINWLRLRIDSNNDTKTDSEGTTADTNDRNAASSPTSNGFAFWAGADPAFLPAQETQNGLMDWATIRIRRSYPLPAGTRVYVTYHGGSWMLARKLRPSGTGTADNPLTLKYIWNQSQAEAQLAEIQTNSRVSVSAPSGSAEIEIPVDWLAATDNEFLVKFRQVTSDPTPRLRLFIRLPGSSAATEVDSAGVDIRPFEKWVSLYTVNDPLSSGFPTDHDVLPRATRVQDWADVPAGAKRITVLVHGYNVPQPDFEKISLPIWVKRLYWSGHPVIMVQGGSTPAHTIGFAWPGDNGFKYRPLWSGTLRDYSRQLFYPADEFNALQTGVPLSVLLQSLVAPDRTIDVMSHSLGNVAVNSALSRPNMANVVRRYVMYDAAMPAEALQSGYSPTPVERAAFLPVAIERGYSNMPVPPLDSKWQQQWSSRTNTQEVLWAAKLEQLPDYAPKPFYDFRWRVASPSEEYSPWRGIFDQSRTVTEIFNAFNPDDQVLHVDAADTSVRLFGDEGGRNGWFNCMAYQKAQPSVAQGIANTLANTVVNGVPYVSTTLPPVFNGDDLDVQYWALLDDPLSRGNIALWNYSPEAITTAEAARQLRRWAELAFWFTPLSGAAGTQPVGVLGPACVSATFPAGPNPTCRNINLGAEGGDPNAVNSHTYLIGGKVFPKVWSAYQVFRKVFSGP